MGHSFMIHARIGGMCRCGCIYGYKNAGARKREIRTFFGTYIFVKKAIKRDSERKMDSGNEIQA